MWMKKWLIIIAALVLALSMTCALGEEQKIDGTCLGVHAFFDGDQNAERGAFEVGYTDLRVELLRVEGNTETVLEDVQVDAQGEVFFTGLEAGVYRIRTTCGTKYGYSKKSSKKKQATSNIMNAGSDRTQTSCDLKLAEGEQLDVGVAIREMAMVTGYVWLDSDGDGIRNNGESGIAGAVLELKGTKNNMTYTLTTDETGDYCFDQVLPGFYKLSCTVPEGTAFTKYSEVGGSARSIFTTAGKTKAGKKIDLNDKLLMDNQNVGVVRESIISGVCYLDANYNGVYDEGEPTLSGVKLELTRQGASQPIATIKSEKNGTYRFPGLRNNVFKLRTVLPEGYFFTKISTAPGGNLFKHLEDRREYTLTDIKVTDEGNIDLNIGAVLPATITGTVYFDDDFSGVRNGKEAVTSGISVALYQADGTRFAVDKTTNKGKYTFEQVPPGEYYITAIAKTGYAFTKLSEGNVLVNQGNGRGASQIFRVGLGDKKTGADIGMILPGTVQGAVFGDANDNGRQDSGETGLAGTTVSLMGNEGIAFTTVLDNSGKYVFDAVMPGRYCVVYELPEGAVFATDINGGKPEGNTGNTIWFDFAMGDQVDMPLVGGVLLGTVSGTAFDDMDADGQMTEDALAGMEITLTPSRSDLTALTARSDAAGSFEIKGIHPDTYTLTVSWPEGYVQSRTFGTTLPVRSGMASQVTELTVRMGDNWKEQILGGVRPGALNGQIWLDANNNGVLDDDETGIAEEEIRVIDLETNSLFAVLTTAADGTFASSGMIPGAYRLEYQPDSNTIPALPGDSAFSQDGNLLVMDGIRLVTGDVLNNVLLGLVRYTSVGGTVWVDKGGDNEPVEGAEITLSGTAEAVTTTDANGHYQFDGLLPGGYQLSIVMPDGTVVVDADDARLENGRNISVMKKTNGRNGSSDPFALYMGHNLMDMDIGAVLPGRLGDRVWLDLNGNGLQDSDEQGIPNVKVTLIRNGVALESTVTDQYGFYFFRNVYPSAYTLQVEYPAEIRPTTMRTDFQGITSVLLEDGSGTLEVSVESSRRNYNADLGFVLVTPGVYPAGYGEGAQMDWSVANRNDLRTN